VTTEVTARAVEHRDLFSASFSWLKILGTCNVVHLALAPRENLRVLGKNNLFTLLWDTLSLAGAQVSQG
jgi:hypothetical protein